MYLIYILLQCVSNLIKAKSSSRSLKTATLEVTSSLLLNSLELETYQETKCLDLVFASRKFSVTDICRFSRNLKKWPKFLDTFQPKLVTYFQKKMGSHGLDATEKSEVLHILAEIISDRISFEEGYFASMFEEAITFNFFEIAAKKGVSWWSLPLHLDCETFSETDVQMTWASLVVLPFIR